MPPGPGPIARQVGRGHLVAVAVLVVLAIVLSVLGDGASAGQAAAST